MSSFKDKIDSITIQNRNSLYPWIEINIKHSDPDVVGLDHSDQLEKRYKHRELELENFKQELIKALEIEHRVREYYDSISEESIKSSHLWHPEFNNKQMHSIILALKTIFEILLKEETKKQ